MMGRKPDPVALKLVKGITRIERMPVNPPPVVDGVPDRPVLATKAAMACWRNFVALLEPMGVLATADQSALASLAQTQADVDDLRRRLANYGEWTYLSDGVVSKETGEVIEGTGIRKAHQEVAMLSDAERRLANLRSVFGLDPSSRAKVPKNEGKPASSKPAKASYF